MSTQLELGTVCAVSVDHHWALEAQVRVQLRSQNTTKGHSPNAILSLIRSHSLWISRANGLSLAVKTNHSDAVRQDGFALSAQVFSTALKSAIADAEVTIRS